MFSYYGNKSKIIKHYPKPKYTTIFEPFSGSARYSLEYYQNQCILNDKYSVIHDIWNWIINAKIDDLDEFPDIKTGESLDDFEINPVLKNLLGFAVNYAVTCPRKTYTKWASRDSEVINLKKRLTKYIGKLSHWKITNMDYLSIPNIEATWFIDPPYQFGGKDYVENKIDYAELALWCMSRKGQVIVCENSKADWLPFRELKPMRGQRKESMEMIWTND